MNRADYRRMKREERKKKNVYVLNEEQYDEQNKVRDISTMNMSMVSTLAIMCMALRDVHGYGAKRLKDVVDNFMLKYGCVVEDVKDKGLRQSEKFDFLAIIHQLQLETGFDLTSYLERDVYGNVWLRTPEELDL